MTVPIKDVKSFQPSMFIRELVDEVWLEELMRFFQLNSFAWQELPEQYIKTLNSLSEQAFGTPSDEALSNQSTELIGSLQKCEDLFQQFWDRINSVGYSHKAVQELAEGWLSLYAQKVPVRIPLRWLMNAMGGWNFENGFDDGLSKRMPHKVSYFLCAVISESTLRFERSLHNSAAAQEANQGTLSTEDFFREFYTDRTGTDKASTGVLLIDVEIERLLFRVTPVLVNSILADVVQRVKTVLGPTDKIAHYSKYDLVVLLSQLKSVNQATQCAAAILGLIETPFIIGTQEFRLRPAIGIAVAPDHAQEPHELISYAQLAALEARTSRERFALFVPDQAQLARRESALENAFYKALDSNMLTLHFQPQVAVRTGLGSSAEALLRWQVSSGEWVPPRRIIAIAERLGLEATLTNWLLNAACQALNQFSRDGIDNMSLSINLTAVDLRTAHLPELIQKSLDAWGVPADKLTLEITEGAMIVEHEQVLQILLALREIGVKLAIDDFGTGYSSLAYLKNLPVDEIKIDQVFVRRLLHSEADRHIVRSVIYLARGFGLKVVAEGAEDMATVNLLKLFECDAIQGYAYSPPLPMDVFNAWWRQRHAHH